MLKRFADLVLFLIVYLQVNAIYAVAAEPQKEEYVGIGLMAKNLMEPVTFISDFVYSACFIIGGAFIFSGVIKFFEHRRSPLMVPISTVIFLFISGVILILLPFTYLIVENDMKFSLMK